MVAEKFNEYNLVGSLEIARAVLADEIHEQAAQLIKLLDKLLEGH